MPVVFSDLWVLNVLVVSVKKQAKNGPSAAR